MPKEIEAGDAGETDNALLAPLTADKFQGYATKDGEPIKEKAPKEAKPAPKAAARVAPKDAGEDEDAEQETGEDDDDEAHEAKPSKSAQARINKAVGKQRAAERRADAAEAAQRATDQRMARLEGQIALLTSGNKPPTKDRNAPDPADYKNGDIDARYIADLARYEGGKAAKDVRDASDKAAETAANEKAAKAQAKRVAAFDDKGSEKYDDFHEVVFDDDFPLTPVLGELALESDLGPEIIYALAGDAKEARRVFGLSPARQAAWFGAREAELSSESSDADEDAALEDDEDATPPKATKSPRPSSHRTRGSGGVPRVDAATSDFASFERMTQAQNRR